MTTSRKNCSLLWHLRPLLLTLIAALFCTPASAAPRVLVDQVGYEPSAPKVALVVTAKDDPAPTKFALINSDTGKLALEGEVKPSGEVHAWTGMVFFTADFSAQHETGHYILRVSTSAGEIASCPFAIQDDVLERNTLSNVIYYFKGQRSSGDFDRADRHLPIPDEPGAFVDAHGGWYDATGDYGIHLSHQNLTSYFNPQQVPLAAWSLLKSYRVLEARDDDNFTEYMRRLLDEGLFGADYLVRIKRANGSFFESITAPGKLKLAKDRAIGNPNWRTQIKTSTSDSTEHHVETLKPHVYEASFRSGGGMGDRSSRAGGNHAGARRLHARTISTGSRRCLPLPE